MRESRHFTPHCSRSLFMFTWWKGVSARVNDPRSQQRLLCMKFNSINTCTNVGGSGGACEIRIRKKI